MKDIVVVGAGPAGASVALLLAQRGMNVTLIEKAHDFERVFRGEGLMPAGLKALHDMGLKDTFEQIASRRLTSWDFYVGAQRRMRVIEPESNGLATQIMDQGALLRAIVEKGKGLPNFEFYSGWQVGELLRDGESVVGVRAQETSIREGREQEKQGQKREWRADCVLACDGRYSRLRKLAKLELEQADAQFDVLWFKLPAPDFLAPEETPFMACLQPDNQFALYPSWDGNLQIGWIVEKPSISISNGPGQKKSLNLAALKERDWCELFAQALPKKLALHFRQNKANLIGPIYLDVQVGCAGQWSLPGLLLIGDAAHPMAPNRAQGINMALRDAIVVANHFSELNDSKLNNPKTDDSPISLSTLQAIQAEREPEIRAIQKMQLAEWKKVKFISTPGLPYAGFKAIATTFGRFKFAQNIWLHEQQGLRKGTRPVTLK